MDEEAFAVFEGALDAVTDIQCDFGRLEDMGVWPDEQEEIDRMNRFMVDLIDCMEDFYMDHVRRDA